ncbi:MAG: FliA/WhiG family RNA polymerase sigma factor [Gemmatimonadales bacterium]|nr:MAG: FliA/WhiG family RNA polymerase sigma factor [Gemmatimonadales bacterium]
MESRRADGQVEELGPEVRDRLLVEHLPLVHHVVRQVLRKRALDLDEEDLVSAGTLGLMEALEKFDPSRGLAVSTFATPRIRGAVLDELRRRDPLSRTVRRRQRELKETRERLGQELYRAPGEMEVAQRLGVDAATLSGWRRDAAVANPVPLDAPARLDDEEGTTSGDLIPDERTIPAQEVLERRERVRLLKEEILALPERERLILSLYYFEELKLHQIASILGVTESRVSQIRSKVLRALRSSLGSRLCMEDA